MKDPTKVEYGETSNFVTRENNNKRKRSREKKEKEKVKRISIKVFLREIVIEREKCKEIKVCFYNTRINEDPI